MNAAIDSAARRDSALAVCICTRNRPASLVAALRSVAAASVTPSQILVSDDSDPAQAQWTAAVCAEFSAVMYVHGPRRGLAANRNNCLDHLADAIRTDVFIDDDLMVRPTFFLDALMAIDRAPAGTIITGREYEDGWHTGPGNVSFWGHQEVVPRGENDYHTILINATVFPRVLFDHVRFDELLRYGSEEIDMCAQAESIGFRVLFQPELINDHHPSPTSRNEYPKFQEASRLYATYKRYRWIERKPLKAAAYGVLAPLHLLGGVIKRRAWRAIPSAVQAIASAMRSMWLHQRCATSSHCADAEVRAR